MKISRASHARRRDAEAGKIGKHAWVLNRQPVAADDCEQDGARLELILDELDEIDTRGDVVRIFEDSTCTKLRTKGRQERKDVPGAVLAAIADEKCAILIQRKKRVS
jgi:hypothetical protein